MSYTVGDAMIFIFICLAAAWLFSIMSYWTFLEVQVIVDSDGNIDEVNTSVR